MVLSTSVDDYYIENNYAMWNSGVQHGVKRKYDEVENPGAVTYQDERQSVLNMSMCKLQIAPPARREQSLRRSVLIFNTLKLIEGELNGEGIKLGHGCPTTTSFLPALQDDDLTLDPLPGASDSLSQVMPCHKLLSGDLLSSLTVSMDCSDSASEEIATSLLNPVPCLPKVATKDNSAADDVDCSIKDAAVSPVASSNSSEPLFESQPSISPAPNSGRTFSVNFATLFDLDTNSSVDVSCTVTSTTTVTKDACSMPVVTGTTSKALTTCRGDVEILGDLDLSLYDLDIFSPNTKLTPLTAEDLMHAFPSQGSFPEAFGAMKSDLLNDDLDHLMQILVGL